MTTSVKAKDVITASGSEAQALLMSTPTSGYVIQNVYFSSDDIESCIPLKPLMTQAHTAFVVGVQHQVAMIADWLQTGADVSVLAGSILKYILPETRIAVIVRTNNTGELNYYTLCGITKRFFHNYRTFVEPDDNIFITISVDDEGALAITKNQRIDPEHRIADIIEDVTSKEGTKHIVSKAVPYKTTVDFTNFDGGYDEDGTPFTELTVQ